MFNIRAEDVGINERPQMVDFRRGLMSSSIVSLTVKQSFAEAEALIRHVFCVSQCRELLALEPLVSSQLISQLIDASCRQRAWQPQRAVQPRHPGGGVSVESVEQLQQLGQRSPTALLHPLVHLNTNYLGLCTVEQHLPLPFTFLPEYTALSPLASCRQNALHRHPSGEEEA
ncbi:Zinc finger MYM-type protein 2 [Liparis tanakae]|uniref:Zinc finger MYM-type protein 2 n=1 Tax=Liparis tanakae TaxID=230148 RepID=A0A4Z2HX89_9TELE|nr:Zinc finger MYM-type protein 2 [Liparis tanakae]